jgi:hypothetical protein
LRPSSPTPTRTSHSSTTYGSTWASSGGRGVIHDWHDRKITAGSEWKGQIDQHLNTAGVILLLVSADFVNSDYCYDIEMKRALERHDKGEARVIPVILRPVGSWQDALFGKLQALPKDGKPVT